MSKLTVEERTKTEFLGRGGHWFSEEDEARKSLVEEKLETLFQEVIGSRFGPSEAASAIVSRFEELISLLQQCY